ncbi:MAG: PASTA domain-containing protein, partial [Planctomycetes bacterium]|nr:PASTA domain-containing protein [Planctomycetota bacterium]
MRELLKRHSRFLLIVLALATICTPLYSEDTSTTEAQPLNVVISEPGGIPEQVLILYNKFISSHGELSSSGGQLSEADLAKAFDLMKNLYVVANETGDPHGTVALLIKKGLDEDSMSDGFKEKYKETQISEGASKFMAQAREQMIEATIKEVIGNRKDIHIGRSDSGNPNSGMRSDLDQTFFVYKVDPDTGVKTRMPEWDQTFLEDFNTKWTGKYGELSLKMLDVVSIKGSARFPDPRFVSFETFSEAHLAAAAELRTMEGAYISPDAITQQVHKRQYETLMGLQEAGKIDPDNPPRVWQEYGSTEDGAGKIANPNFEFAVREMIGGSPQLTPQAAFSAAIANWMMLQHSFKGNDFNVKYHLRTFDDSIYVKILQEQGGGMEHKGEYTKMTPEQRDRIAKEALERLFPGDEVKQRRHKAAMDISAELRNKHTGSGGGMPEPSSPALAGAEDQKIYDPLLQELYGEKYTPGDTSAEGQIRLQTQLDAAKACHKKLASEFCIQSARHSSVDAFNAMRGGAICEEVRPFFEVEGRSWDETKANIMEGAKLTLMWGIYDLGMVDGYDLMKNLAKEVDASNWDLAKLYLESQFMPIKAYRANPEAYHRALSARVSELGESARNYALDQWGFEKVAEFETAGTILKKQRMVWNPRKLFKNMFYDMGTVASIGQVAEVYVLSKGDVNQVLAKAFDEVLLAVPIVGPAINMARGGVENVALMGFVMYFPPAGKVLLAYNLAKSVYIITDAEYFKPARNNAADAIYRGFAGPETKAYGEPGAPPPVWTDDMEKEYNDVKWRVDIIQATLNAHETGMYPAGCETKDAFEDYVGTKEKAQRELKAAKAEFKQFDDLRKAWLEYRDGKTDWMGGFITGSGAVLEQIWFEDSILAHEKLTPIYGFLTGGVVDLRVDYDPQKEGKEILDLQVKAESGKTIEEQIHARARLLELKLLEERYNRAQNYIERMKTNKEMRVRFIRDSLYENIREQKINIEQFLKEYYEKNERKMYKELVKLDLISDAVPENLKKIGMEPPPPPAPSLDDLISTESVGRTGDWDPVMLPHELMKIPDSVKELVKKRFTEDFERSQRLIAAYKKQEKNREEQQIKAVEKAIVAFQNQGFGKAMGKFTEDERFLKFLDILRFSSVKRKAPIVKMTFFKSLSNKAENRKGKAGEPLVEPHMLDVQAKVHLDHTLYPPPYATHLIELTGKDAASVSDSVNGIKLLPETVSRVKELAGKHREALDKGEALIAVGSVVCKKVTSMPGARPETLEGLPGYENGKAVSGEVILGQQAEMIPAKPFTVTVDPVKVKVIDASGKAITDVKDLVKFGEEPAKMATDGYWGTHTFTKYDEELPIRADYKFSEEKIISGTASLSINDIENWLQPEMGEKEIVIQLQVLMPTSVSVKGRISVDKLPDTISISNTASVKSGSLGVNMYVGVPESEEGGDGAFDFQSKRALLPGEPINVTAVTNGTVEIKLEDDKTDRRSVAYSGSKDISVPSAGGYLDAGTITLKADMKLAEVPYFNTATPPLYQDYMGEVRAAGLIPKPSIGEQPDDPKLAHCVIKTIPTPGSLVPPGSAVAVEIYSGSDLIVPDVVGLHIKNATEILGKKKITAKPQITGPPPVPNKEFTVITQSLKAGSRFSPGIEMQLQIYGRAADMVVTVPDLTDLSIAQAAKALQDVGLRLKK